MLGTHYGHWTLLVLIAGVLILSGALAWMAVGRCNPDDDEDACLELAHPDDYGQALWLAWGIFFDPGTQTGLAPTAPPRHKFVLLAFSTCGFVFNLVVLGLIVSTLQNLLRRWERLHRVIIANDHTVILGWTDKTLFSIGELAEMLDDSALRGGTLVVMGELPTYEMREEVAITYPNWRQRFPRVRLIFRQGKQYEVDDLKKLSLHAARHVVVLGCGAKPGLADSHTITTCCALRCLPQPLPASTLVIVELQLVQNLEIARQVAGRDSANALSVVPCCVGRAVDMASVLCATAPAVGRAMQELMSATGQDIHTIEIWDALVGLTLDQAAKLVQKSLIVGVLRSRQSAAADISSGEDSRRSSKGGLEEASGFKGPASKGRFAALAATARVATPSAAFEGWRRDSTAAVDLARYDHGGTPRTPSRRHLKDISRRASRGVMYVDSGASMADATGLLIAPPGSTKLQRGDQLCVIAESAHSMRPASKGGKGGKGMDESKHAAPHTPWSPAPTQQRSDKPEVELVSSRSEEESMASLEEVSLVHRAHTAQEAGGRVVLLVGWTRGQGRMLRTLDGRLPPDSHVYLLSRRPLKARRQDMAMHGLELHGGPLDRYSDSAEPMDSGPDSGRCSPRQHRSSFDKPLPQGSALAGVAATAGAAGAAAAKMQNLAAEASGSERSSVPPRQFRGSHSPTEGVAYGGLRHVTLHHVLGTPSDEAELRRLPLERADVAIVAADEADAFEDDRADDGTGGVELQINDAEALTSTVLLRRLRAELVDEQFGLSTKVPPLTLVTQFEDVLTHRLLTLQRDLLEPAPDDEPEGGDDVENLVLHRNQLETAALATAALGGAAWTIIRRLLDPDDTTSITAVCAAACVAPKELATARRDMPSSTGGLEQASSFKGSASKGRFAALAATAVSVSGGVPDGGGPEGGVPLSFWQLHARLQQLQQCILLGWRRADDPGEDGTPRVVLNPPDKGTKLLWSAADELLVIQASGLLALSQVT